MPSLLASIFGIPGIVDRKAVIIPTPAIFIFAGILVLFTLIPVWFAQEKK